MKLLIATTNQNKFKEIKELLKEIPVNLVSLNDMRLDISVEETGKTFEENAVIKAKEYGEASKMLTLSEDSGLEVDALGGKPGIYSARYIEGTDKDRMNQILREMENVSDDKRTARYCEVVALYNPLIHEIKKFNGISEGKITTEPKGKNGFGYDPIFYSFDLKKTFAEASMNEKNKLSHRAKAIQKLRKYLLDDLIIS